MTNVPSPGDNDEEEFLKRFMTELSEANKEFISRMAMDNVKMDVTSFVAFDMNTGETVIGKKTDLIEYIVNKIQNQNTPESEEKND